MANEKWGVLNVTTGRSDLIERVDPFSNGQSEWTVRASGRWSDISSIARKLNAAEDA